MGQEDRRVGVLFSKSTEWVAEANFLRSLLLDSPLVETFKWRAACYTYDQSNVAMIFRLKNACGVSFFRGALLDDPDNQLEAPGPNSQSARYFKVRSLARAKADAETLSKFVEDAVKIHAEGRRVDFHDKDELSLPAVLKDVLATDQTLRLAFDALTRGRQRSWIMHIDAAKKDATRLNRIAKGRAKILAGKGQSEY